MSLKSRCNTLLDCPFQDLLIDKFFLIEIYTHRANTKVYYLLLCSLWSRKMQSHS